MSIADEIAELLEERPSLMCDVGGECGCGVCERLRGWLEKLRRHRPCPTCQGEYCALCGVAGCPEAGDFEP